MFDLAFLRIVVMNCIVGTLLTCHIRIKELGLKILDSTAQSVYSWHHMLSLISTLPLWWSVPQSTKKVWTVELSLPLWINSAYFAWTNILASSYYYVFMYSALSFPIHKRPILAICLYFIGKSDADHIGLV